MSASPQKRSLTYEGERGKPAPDFAHSRVQTRLMLQLARQVKRTGIEVLPELHLDLSFPDGQTWTPDLCLRPAEPADWENDVLVVTEAPLAVMEIPVPPQTREGFLARAPIYLRRGVRSAWVIDPRARCAMVLTSPDRPPTRHFGGIVTDPATGAQVDLDEVFR